MLYQIEMFRSAMTSPETRFFAALLTRAVDDLVAYRNNRGEKSHGISAAIWLGMVAESDCYESLVSFEECCDILDIDADRTRNVLMRSDLDYVQRGRLT